MAAVPGRDQRLQRRQEGRGLVEAEPEPRVLRIERLVGVLAGADRRQIGGEVGALARLQAEAIAPVEPRDHGGEAGQRAVMEIGRGVADAEQRRRIQGAVARLRRGRRHRSDVVAPPVDEIAVRDMAGRAGPPRHAREGAVEDRLAASGLLAGAPVERPVAREQRRRQEIERVHIGGQRIEHQRGRFRAAELAHDHVAGEFAQARDPPVPPIRRGEADAAQARYIERVQPPVAAARVEETVIDVDPPLAAAEPGDEERPVDVAPVVAGRTGEAERAGARAEDFRRIEQHVAIGNEKEPFLVHPALLEIEHQPGQGLLLAQRAARRQPVGGGQGRRPGLEP